MVAHRLAFNRVVSNGDGNEFRPERWEKTVLNGRRRIKFPSNDYSFITFSAGVRPCIGRHMSLMEMKCAVFHFAYNFDVSLPKGSEFEYGDARKLSSVTDTERRYRFKDSDQRESTGNPVKLYKKRLSRCRL